MENESLENASPEDLMQMLAAQFGGITKTLEDSAKAFEKAKSKHFHARDYIFTSSEGFSSLKTELKFFFRIR